MSNLSFYCAICDVEINENELEGSLCPFCGTEIPEASENEEEELE